MGNGFSNVYFWFEVRHLAVDILATCNLSLWNACCCSLAIFPYKLLAKPYWLKESCVKVVLSFVSSVFIWFAVYLSTSVLFFKVLYDQVFQLLSLLLWDFYLCLLFLKAFLIVPVSHFFPEKLVNSPYIIYWKYILPH